MHGNLNEAVEMLLNTSLREIRDRAPHVPGYFEEMLYICTLRQFPTLQQWFEEELSVIAHQGEEIRRWSELLQMGILQAAKVQAPPSKPASIELWVRLMQIPRFANTAFFTLALTPLEQLVRLDEWWAVKPEHPEKTLRRVVSVGMKVEPERFPQRLRRLGATWEIDLRMKVNEALAKEGLEPIFPPVPEPAEV